MRHYYIVSYDISDPTRLAKVLRTVEDFGDRLQYSVFLCQLSDKELTILRERLHDRIDMHKDQVLFVRLMAAGPDSDVETRVDHLGRRPHLVTENCRIL